MLVGDLDSVLAGVREDASGHLEQTHSCGIDIGARGGWFPRACSGERYEAVPMIEPTCVSWVCAWEFAAIPKSVTFSVPSLATKTFCSFTSR